MSNPITEGDLAPAFHLPAINAGGDAVDSTSLSGQPYVIYFYPKADTPGCTKEACGFQAALTEIGRSLTVIGVSKDSLTALRRFATKYDLRFPLAADETGGTSYIAETPDDIERVFVQALLARRG